jgi:hypothetical protein
MRGRFGLHLLFAPVKAGRRTLVLYDN